MTEKSQETEQAARPGMRGLDPYNSTEPLGRKRRQARKRIIELFRKAGAPGQKVSSAGQEERIRLEIEGESEASPADHGLDPYNTSGSHGHAYGK